MVKQIEDSKNTPEDGAADESNLTAFQLKDRKLRTCFVGNIPLDVSSKQLKKLFGEYGKIEKVWFRSVATVLDSKIPLKGKIIMKEFSDQKDNKNAYVLYERVEQAALAKEKMN